MTARALALAVHALGAFVAGLRLSYFDIRPIPFAVLWVGGSKVKARTR